MPTYRTADREDLAMLKEVMEEYHERLTEHDVRVGLLYAHAPTDEDTGKPKGVALKLHGEAALAIVKINSLKDRVEGKPDATVVLDGDQWPDHSEEKKRAILDHELAHLLTPGDTDDAGRPKLKMRGHDFTLAGFWDVVDRHKQHAAESEAYTDIHREFSQRVFHWG